MLQKSAQKILNFNWISSSTNFGFQANCKLFSQSQAIKTFDSISLLEDRKIALKYVGNYPKRLHDGCVHFRIFFVGRLVKNPPKVTSTSYGCFKRQWIKWSSNLSIHFNEWHEWWINGETRIMSWPTWHQNQLENLDWFMTKINKNDFSQRCVFILAIFACVMANKLSKIKVSLN